MNKEQAKELKEFLQSNEDLITAYNEIQYNLDKAEQYLADAESLAEEYNINFRTPITRVHSTYTARTPLINTLKTKLDCLSISWPDPNFTEEESALLKLLVDSCYEDEWDASMVC